MHVRWVVVVVGHHKGRVLRLGRDLMRVVRWSQVTLRARHGLRLAIASREKPLLLESCWWPSISVHRWTFDLDGELAVGRWLSVLLLHAVWVLAGLVWEGVRRLTVVRVLVCRRVLHHICLVRMLLHVWVLLAEVLSTLRVSRSLTQILSSRCLLNCRLRFLIIFNISLISLFNSVRSINLVDFDVFVSKSLSACLSVNFKMV